MAFINIRRYNDVISFEPQVITLALKPEEFEMVVFRNFDRKAGHWIMPVDGADDSWFSEKMARSTEKKMCRRTAAC